MTKKLSIEMDSDRAPMLILAHKSIKGAIINIFKELNNMITIRHK